MSKNFVVGVDVGGSKINAVLFENGKIFKSVKSETPRKNQKEFLNKLEKTIREVIPQGGKFLGIGCGIAGILDLKVGTVLKSPNLEFLDGFNVKNWLSKKFNCAARIDNDARSFTCGEYFFGAGKGYKNLVGLTLGTGVGGGIIIGGKIVYGNGAAGEIGHMIINYKDDLETLTVKYMQRFKYPPVNDLYRSKRSRAVSEALRNFEFNLGIGLANLVNILDPEAIIIGGGIAGAAEFFLPHAEKTMKKFIFSPKARKNVKILRGKLGEDAGAIGAAALFNDNQL